MKGLTRMGTVAALAFTAASAGMTTTVGLRTQDDSLPKLGLPTLRVEVQGVGPVALDTFRGWVADDAARLSFVKSGERDPSPDYTLVVRFLEATPGAGEVPFEASLLTHDGRVAWLVDGRTVTDAVPVEPIAWRTIGRNVISALVRDGWLQQKQDPNDPPPAPPIVSSPR